MPITYSKSELITIQGFRQCNFVYSYILSNGLPFLAPYAENVSTRAKLITNSLDSWGEDFETKKSFVKDMLKSFEDNLLPDSEFDWIDMHNDWQCCYLWVFICNIANTHMKSFLGVNLDNHSYANLKVTQNPSDTLGRYRAIIDIIDQWNTNNIEKLHFLDQLKSSYYSNSYDEELYTWLNKKDEKQCTWAFDYLRKNQTPHGFIQPKSTSEQYYLIVSSLELLFPHPDTKKLCLIKMKKAWSQKKHRDKQVGKKAYNIVMGVDVKEKLDRLAKHHNRNINETLEQLVAQEFKKILEST